MIAGAAVGGCTADTPACRFMTWGPDYVRPDCCTDHLVELLFFVDELLHRHGLMHWIDFGTLLGAVRDGRLIPWDWDVDVSVLASDFDRILALRDEVADAGHRLEQSGRIVRIVYSEVNDVHVDVWPWVERDGRLESDDSFDEWPGMRGTSAFPRRFVDSLTTVRLHGREFPAPAPVDEFLVQHRYGPGYLTPRRGTTTFHLRPDIGLDELSPAVQDALDRVARQEERLVQLLNRSALARRRPGWLWQVSGLPVEPAPERLAELRVSVPGAGPGPESILRSLAVLDEAVDELEHPRARFALRRTHRRLVRLRERTAAAVARRPHHAGFPFG